MSASYNGEGTEGLRVGANIWIFVKKFVSKTSVLNLQRDLQQIMKGFERMFNVDPNGKNSILFSLTTVNGRDCASGTAKLQSSQCPDTRAEQSNSTPICPSPVTNCYPNNLLNLFNTTYNRT